MLTRTAQLVRKFPKTPTIENKSNSGLTHLISAAVVDSTFRKQLLSNPALALENGYSGQHFQLSYEEHRRIISIKAKSLPDFATQLFDYHPI